MGWFKMQQENALGKVTIGVAKRRCRRVNLFFKKERERSPLDD